MTTAPTSSVTERLFTLGDLHPVPPGPARGLLVATTPTGPRRGGPEIWHTGGPGDLATAALALASRRHVAAVAFHPHPGGHPAALRLPLRFALHLAAVRDLLPDQHAPVTVAERPPVGGDLVRVPHLLAFRWFHQVLDLVVWEVVTRTGAQGWLGGPLPDQALFERRLPALLTLRRRSRQRALPDSRAGRRLEALLADRYLSIRLVYEHPDLFADLTADWNGAKL